MRGISFVLFRAVCHRPRNSPGRIEVEKSSSENTVVWNPWAEVAASMADMGNDEWPHFVCVEAANCRDNAVTLAPGETHAMDVTIRVANSRE